MGRVIDDLGSLGRASKPLGLRVYTSATAPDATLHVNAMIAIIDEDGDGRTARLAMSNGATWDTIQFTREGEYAFDWTFDTGTSDADPGAGEVRANHATLSSATQLFISETDRLGLSQASAITLVRGRVSVNMLTAAAPDAAPVLVDDALFSGETDEERAANIARLIERGVAQRRGAPFSGDH